MEILFAYPYYEMNKVLKKFQYIY